jgi:hypothetical protein
LTIRGATRAVPLDISPIGERTPYSVGDENKSELRRTGFAGEAADSSTASASHGGTRSAAAARS